MKLRRPPKKAPSDALDSDFNFDFVAARPALLDWFAANGRVFPWRSEPTPFRVWISEIMLQQTTTQTVVGYFERFLRRFPNVAALASADETEVLKYWEGLGYYRRAKALRSAAIAVVERFGGVFPKRFDDVLSLPGVGRYAAGAILSFGFDRRAPILEANTTRLNARLLGLRLQTSTAPAQKILWRFAENWLPEESPRRPANLYRNFNAALTDLGRLVCVPTNPNCAACPLAPFCETARLDLQKVVPAPKKKPEIVERTDVALWISRRDLTDVSPDATSASDVLLVRRPENALWAGLWDFPRFETTLNDGAAAKKSAAPDFSADAALCDRIHLFLETEVGAVPFDYRPGRALKTVRHSVTRYRISLRLCRLAGAERAARSVRREKTLLDAADVETKTKSTLPKIADSPNFAIPTTNDSGGKRVAAELRWVPLSELDALPLSSPGRKLAQFIVEKTSNANDARTR